MLYTLSHSPNQCDLPALLRLVTESDALLLMQDGVLAGLSDCAYLKLLFSVPLSLYALRDDLEARGLMNYFSNRITVIKYSQFVELTERYRRQIAW